MELNARLRAIGALAQRSRITVAFADGSAPITGVFTEYSDADGVPALRAEFGGVEDML
jgi:hypothetical protein